MKSFLNPEGHQNRISDSKVMVILLRGLIWPIGGVTLGRVCARSLRSRLVIEGKEYISTIGVFQVHSIYLAHFNIHIVA